MSKTLNNNKIEYIIELDEFPDYFVSSEGDVYSEKHGKMKKLKTVLHRGYHCVVLCKNKKRYTKKVHRLLAYLFIANPNNYEFIDHINHIRSDNSLENLRWVSHRDNSRNTSISKINISGYQGVSFDKKGNCWRSQWRNTNKKLCVKSFSVNKYGDEEAKQLAIEYREKMVNELYNRV